MGGLSKAGKKINFRKAAKAKRRESRKAADKRGAHKVRVQAVSGARTKKSARRVEHSERIAEAVAAVVDKMVIEDGSPAQPASRKAGRKAGVPAPAAELRVGRKHKGLRLSRKLQRKARKAGTGPGAVSAQTGTVGGDEVMAE